MKRAVCVLILLFAVLAGLCFLRLMVGGGVSGVAGTGLGTGRLGWSPDDTVMGIRAARVLAALAVGGALGAAGIILQTLLRNPLASPDVVGVSAGASVGVMLSLLLTTQNLQIGVWAGGSAWQLLPAALGAFAVLCLLVFAAGMREAAAGTTVLLTGVVISVLCGAIVLLLQHLMRDGGFSTARILMGGLTDEPTHAGPAAALVGFGVLALTFGAGRTLDVLMLPYDEAVSVGVNVRRARLILLATTGLLCAVAVVLAGPIGFIGLIAPHAARLLMGTGTAGHTLLIPAAALSGAAIVVGADTLVRLVDLGMGRMPIGILTALIGGPTLIWLLRRESYGHA